MIPPEPTALPPAPRRLEAFPAGSAPEDRLALGIDWAEVLDSISDAIFIHDAASGRIIHANATACEMYGYNVTALRRVTIGELSEDSPAYSEAAARRRLTLALTVGPQLFEWRARAADGRVFWVEVAVRAGHGASAGRCFVTVRDISVRKDLAAASEHAAAALQRSEERFRLLLGRMPTVAVQGCGPDGVVHYWNAASERLYGYTAAEALGHSILSLIAPPPLRAEMRVALHQMLVTGQPLAPAEMQLQRKDGSPVPVFSSATVVQVPGTGPELYRLDFDLTDRKRAEAERLELERRLLHSQKLESLGALAGGIAHDFNNLLTGVLGNLELARTELPADDRTLPLVDDAITAARLAANLTQQMLAYAGRSRFRQQPVDLNTVVRQAEPLLHAAAEGRARLEFDLVAELPLIEADSAQLAQLLVNLVTNAAEAVEHPPGTIEVRTAAIEFCSAEHLSTSCLAEKPAPQPFVCLEVVDSGCGMDAATARRVCEPFFSTKFAGRGLGLPVVFGIVRAHHGALFVESLPARGSVIRVLLPLARPPTATIAPEAGSGSGPHPLPSLVLVADDEEPVRRIAARMGQRLGIDIITASDGESALELCRLHAGSLTCALVDLTMPGMGGLECLRAMRTVQPDLPTVLMSGFPEEPRLGHAGDPGFSAFLQKPFSIEQFADALRLAVAGPGAGD
jgi:PAS domain S-box-containing protein